MSFWDNDRSLAKWPYCGSANQGGMIFCCTASLMATAQGRVSSYVSIENGPASPGRWQFWQFFCKMGATSLVNVGAVILPICAKRHAAEQNANRIAKARFTRSFRGFEVWFRRS